MTAYFLWLGENRERITKALGTGFVSLPFTTMKGLIRWFISRNGAQVAKAGGDEWRAMSEKEKDTWKQRSEADKKRYAQEKAGIRSGGVDSEDEGTTKRKARK